MFECQIVDKDSYCILVQKLVLPAVPNRGDCINIDGDEFPTMIVSFRSFRLDKDKNLVKITIYVE